ncbi:hypothetical protein X947_5191 [Burkholderia pseudomallei MSHR7334]|nr:hypothetical protein X947_5191 [Burkholderia pseudomallei MSHR7334]
MKPARDVPGGLCRFGAGACGSEPRGRGAEAERSGARKVGNVGVGRTQPEFPRPEARGSRLEARGPRPEARGRRPEVGGPRPEARGPRSEAQGPRSEIRDPSPSPSPSLEAHAKPSSPENPGDPKPLRIAETPASRQAAESNT